MNNQKQCTICAKTFEKGEYISHNKDLGDICEKCFIEIACGMHNALIFAIDAAKAAAIKVKSPTIASTVTAFSGNPHAMHTTPNPA